MDKSALEKARKSQLGAYGVEDLREVAKDRHRRTTQRGGIVVSPPMGGEPTGGGISNVNKALIGPGGAGIDKSIRRGFPSTREMMALSRQNPEKAWALLKAKNLAILAYRVREEEFGKKWNEFKAANFAAKNQTALGKLDAFLVEHEIPPVLFLRCQFRWLSGKLWVNALYSAAALDRFRRWEEKERSRVLSPKQAEEHLQRLAALKAPENAHKHLEEERARAEAYLRKMAPHYALQWDDEALAWAERAVLPGAYLLTVPSMVEAWKGGGLEPIVRKRLGEALEIQGGASPHIRR